MTRTTSNKKKPSAPAKLSRVQICQKYKLSEQTFRIVTEATGLLSLEPERQHGRVVYNVPAAADKILKLASLCPHSLATFRPPATRFILYALLTGTVEEAVTSLEHRHLLSGRVNATAIETIKEHMLKVAPPALRKYIGTGAVPSAKLMPTVMTLMRLWGLSVVYECPEYLDQLCFPDLRSVHFINQLVSTHSCTDAGRAVIMEKAVGHALITGEGLLVYRSVFHDMEFMRDTDFRIYFAGLAPSVRAAYKDALESTTAEFAIKSNLFSDNLVYFKHQAKVLRSMARDLLERDDLASFTAAQQALKASVQLDDYIGKLRPGEKPQDVPEFLRDVTVEEYDHDEEFGYLKDYYDQKAEDTG